MILPPLEYYSRARYIFWHYFICNWKACFLIPQLWYSLLNCQKNGNSFLSWGLLMTCLDAFTLSRKFYNCFRISQFFGFQSLISMQMLNFTLPFAVGEIKLERGQFWFFILCKSSLGSLLNSNNFCIRSLHTKVVWGPSLLQNITTHLFTRPCVLLTWVTFFRAPRETGSCERFRGKLARRRNLPSLLASKIVPYSTFKLSFHRNS